MTTWFNTPATKLLTTLAGAITGVEVLLPNGTPARLSAPSIILACGGFESSRQLRAQHLGPGWDLAYVRGTAHNTGDGFAMTSAFSQPVGDWSGCHSTAWDAAAPKNEGDPVLTNAYTKSGYPLGIMVNLSGNRFVDEGVDFRNFTYARFGNEILKQPGGMAWQVWDSKTVGWLRAEEYADNVAKEKVKAETAEELACCMFPVDQAAREKFLETLAEYNAAVVAHQADFPGRVWDPAVKDGVSTKALKLPKSNWALTIEKGPFLAVKVTCGVTFTFGGLKIEPETAAVLSRHTGKPVEGLFACGEMVGGLFWGNYPGGFWYPREAGSMLTVTQVAVD